VISWTSFSVSASSRSGGADVAEPTTIGLGDTFVVGVLAVVAQGKAATWT
jgi:hypothetical protein